MSTAGIETNFGKSSIPPGEKTSSYTRMEELGIDQFLTLLIAQLENQDPLNPLDSAEFTAQLAQFTSVEQLYGMNKNLSGIQETLYNQGEQQNLFGLIGKTVKVNDNTIFVGDGVVQSSLYDLHGSGDVTVNVYDDNGLKVRTLYPGWKEEGEHNVNWDGRDDYGEMVGDGTYTFEVAAQDENANYISANTYISGEVTGVTYEYGYPYLMIGDRLVSKDYNIVEVSKTTTE